MAMRAFRRAFLSLRNKNGFRIRTSRNHFAESEPTLNRRPDPNSTLERFCPVPEDKSLSLDRLFYCTQPVCGNAFSGKRGFTSQVTEDDASQGFSELEESGNGDDQLVSEPDLSDEDGIDEAGELELSRRRRTTLSLCSAIMDSKDLSVPEAVEKWVSEGNELTRMSLPLASHQFRKLQMSGKALELAEYLEANNHYEFDERSYGSRVGLIAKFHGLKKAEDYIETIPDSHRGVSVYQSLLANCAVTNKTKKAEEVFQKMRDLGFPVTLFACNQLIILYKRQKNKKKLADVLQLMERENIKPSITTYKLLISSQSYDTDVVEKMLETMKSEGIEPDMRMRFIVARHYVTCGFEDKAEAVMKQMEGNDLQQNRQACRSLMVLYAELGKAEEVQRVWKVCEPDPKFYECVSAIEAWGILARVEEAEAVFDRVLKTSERPSNKLYTMMLRVYARNKELKKGEDLVERMSDRGLKVGPLAWNSLVKLYVEAGDIEKADSVLKKFARQSRVKPLPSTYVAIMRLYAKKGDIHNSERMFYSMKMAGHMIKWHQFRDLIDAYVSAKKPAYGMWERMKAENIFPNKVMSEKLKQVDPFKKTTTWYSYLVE